MDVSCLNINNNRFKTRPTFLNAISCQKLKTCDIFHMPQPKGDNKSYLIKIIRKKFTCRKTVKRSKNYMNLIELKLDGKFLPKTKNFWHFSHVPPERWLKKLLIVAATNKSSFCYHLRGVGCEKCQKFWVLGKNLPSNSKSTNFRWVFASFDCLPTSEYFLCSFCYHLSVGACEKCHKFLVSGENSLSNLKSTIFWSFFVVLSKVLHLET